VKQKTQANADFLGVLPIQRHVVAGCCIRTTILGRFRNKSAVPARQFLGRHGSKRSGTGPKMHFVDSCLRRGALPRVARTRVRCWTPRSNSAGSGQCSLAFQARLRGGGAAKGQTAALISGPTPRQVVSGRQAALLWRSGVSLQLRAWVLEGKLNPVLFRQTTSPVHRSRSKPLKERMMLEKRMIMSPSRSRPRSGRGHALRSRPRAGLWRRMRHHRSPFESEVR
jgi:hypothetical protein